jgi:hypothetical protein
MKTWQKAGIITLISLTIGGIYLFSVFQHRRNPGVHPNTNPEQNLSRDDSAPVRMMFPTSFDDVVKLQGTSVWMKNGYSIPYYPYDSGRIVFAKPAGFIPPAQRLDIKKVIKAVAPDDIDDGISHGARQVFAIFTLPGDATQFATVIGVIDSSQEGYFCDVLFYYEDPHSIYDYWPKNVWTAIDAHQVLPGMSELQVQMSIGHNEHTDSSSDGNGTVTFDQSGKKWTIAFVNNHATEIESK